MPLHRHAPFTLPATPPLSRPRRQALVLGAGLLLPALPAALVHAAMPGAATSQRPVWRQRADRALMGTTVRLVAETDDPARAAALPEALDHAFARMAGLAALMTHYEATSGTGAIALAAGLQAVPVAPPLMAVLQQAQALAARSGGAFDITIGAAGQWRFDDPARLPRPEPTQVARSLPLVGWQGLRLDARAGTACLARRGMRLDVGGIAKLPILAAGLHALREAGVTRALVNGGGDVLAISPPAQHARGQQASPAATWPAWRVGVRDPARPEALIGVLALHGGVVASSGDYERCTVDARGQRWHHVLDPRSGRPSAQAHGVTLLARTPQGPAGSDATAGLDEAVARVNGLGAALMVLDERAGRALLAGQPQVQTLVTRRDGSRWGALNAALQPA